MPDIATRAMLIATEAHQGQFRKYPDTWGIREPFINHPARVAAAVAMYLGPASLAHMPDKVENVIGAAWCHDVVEDCDISVTTLALATSPACATLVSQLTNPSKQHPHKTRAERKAMDRDHIDDICNDAKLIKILDRTDNLKGLVNAPKDFAILYLGESEQLAMKLMGVDDKAHDNLVVLISHIRRRIS